MDKHQRQIRDEIIVSQCEEGLKVSEIASFHNLTRDSVYRILDNWRTECIKTGDWDEDDSFDWRDIRRLAWVTKMKMLYALGWSEREIARLTNYSQAHCHRLRKYSKDYGYANTGVVLRLVDEVTNEDDKVIPPADYTCQPMNGEYMAIRSGDDGKTYFVRYDSFIGKHRVISCFLRDYNNGSLVA